MSQIPVRIFKSNKSKRCIIPICAGKNIFNPADGTSKIIGEVLLKIEDGFCKTKEPAIIDAIFNNPLVSKFFKKPIYKTNDGIIEMSNGKPVVEKYTELPHEIFLGSEHEKAVKFAISEGFYEYIKQEDLDSALEVEKAESKKLELLELKKKNKAKKESLGLGLEKKSEK